MRIYRSYTKAFAYEILIASLALFGVVLWGSTALVIISLIGLRPLILKIDKKDVDERFWFKHYNIIKLSIVLTSVTIIIIYSVSDLYLNSYIDADFFLKMILPYFLLIHGCIGSLFFRK